MKRLLRFMLFVAVVAAVAVGGCYAYRSCSLKGCSASVMTAQAEQLQTAEYSNVLDDLSVADNFDISLYPTVENDYSLRVIQIAESTDRSVFAYVYSPSGKAATSLNVSTEVGNELKYTNCALLFCNASDTLQKYRIEGLTVLSDVVRFYEVASVFRKWDENTDIKPGGDNTVNEVVYPVSKRWTAISENGTVKYAVQDIETVTVQSKHVGYLTYSDGDSFTLGNGYKFENCDSHYVAFSADRNIDEIMEADVSFVTRSATAPYLSAALGVGWTYGNAVKREVTLTSEEIAGNAANGWFAEKHTWYRIQSVSDFIKEESVTAEAKTAIADCEWVLRFFESKRVTEGIGNDRVTTRTDVSEVTLLRLKFDTDGKVYNLGVVDNKQSGDDKPDNIEKKCGDDIKAFFTRIWNFICKYWNWFLIGGIVVVCLAVCSWLLGLLRKKKT